MTRNVVISERVQQRIQDLESYLVDELKLSETAAVRRCLRIRVFLHSLHAPVSHRLCRFFRWRRMGWRCAVFERHGVFAYELFEDGVIVRDMGHTGMLTK